MLKFNNKRDVDRHVSQMTKNLNENEVKSGFQWDACLSRRILRAGGRKCHKDRYSKT